MLNRMLLSTSLLALFAGCGLDGNTLWEVSRLDGDRPASCYVNNMPPTMTETSMGVHDNIGPWELYEGPDSKMYLILGDKKTTVEGTKGDGYSFQWTITDTDAEPPPVNITVTDTVANNVSFKVSGDTLSGTWEVKETHTCSGSGCANSRPNCTVTNQIRGRRLEVDREQNY